MTESDTRRARAGALNLHGLLAHWSEIASEAWIDTLLGREERERARRGLERRLRAAHIGRFKPLCGFDWNWPKRCDRTAIEPPRVCRRPQLLRGWGHGNEQEAVEQIFT